MKILTKYIIKKFLSYFLSSFTVVSIFVFIINLFETANQLAKKNIDYLAKSYVEYMNLKNLKFILFKLRFFSIPIVFN